MPTKLNIVTDKFSIITHSKNTSPDAILEAVHQEILRTNESGNQVHPWYLDRPYNASTEKGYTYKCLNSDGVTYKYATIYVQTNYGTNVECFLDVYVSFLNENLNTFTHLRTSVPKQMYINRNDKGYVYIFISDEFLAIMPRAYSWHKMGSDYQTVCGVFELAREDIEGEDYANQRMYCRVNTGYIYTDNVTNDNYRGITTSNKNSFLPTHLVANTIFDKVTSNNPNSTPSINNPWNGKTWALDLYTKHIAPRIFGRIKGLKLTTRNLYHLGESLEVEEDDGSINEYCIIPGNYQTNVHDMRYLIRI